MKINSNHFRYKILYFVGSRTLDAFAYAFSQVYRSCAALMSGKTWVFGGTGNFKRQLSSVGQCQLQTEGTLP